MSASTFTLKNVSISCDKILVSWYLSMWTWPSFKWLLSGRGEVFHKVQHISVFLSFSLNFSVFLRIYVRLLVVFIFFYIFLYESRIDLFCTLSLSLSISNTASSAFCNTHCYVKSIVREKTAWWYVSGNKTDFILWLINFIIWISCS